MEAKDPTIPSRASTPRLAHSARETADLLGGVCVKTIYRLVARGRLTRVKGVRTLLITRSSIEALLKSEYQWGVANAQRPARQSRRLRPRLPRREACQPLDLKHSRTHRTVKIKIFSTRELEQPHSTQVRLSPVSGHQSRSGSVGSRGRVASN
jgi:hypothetical protein